MDILIDKGGESGALGSLKKSNEVPAMVQKVEKDAQTTVCASFVGENYLGLH